MRHLASGLAAAGLVLVASTAATAAIVMINNGLAPPNPANVINFPDGTIIVQNTGCDFLAQGRPCPMPGSPTAVALIEGGEVGSLSTHESSSITMSGGTRRGGIITFDASSITILGGVQPTTYEELIALDSSAIMIFGTGFAVNGAPVGYGPIASGEGQLTGTLLSGDLIDSYFCHFGCTSLARDYQTGLITLVPEPATLTLLGLGLLTLCARGRLGQ